jgi:DNA adenine methylase
MEDSLAAASRTAGSTCNQAVAEPGSTGTPKKRVCNNDDLQSPLRYPGGKRQLVPFFIDILKINGLAPLELFVEPFTGGAAVSLHLLASGAADKIILAERDPLLYAFWQRACYHTDVLVDDVLNAEVTLEEWHRLRENPGRSLREMAYACLFLNRTSYSGILHGRAGPIGGQRQLSSYKIDCRFPRLELAERIRRIGKLTDEGRVLRVMPHDFEVSVWEIEDSFRHLERLYYLDPPFYDKGSRLYRLPFGPSDHARLARLLVGFGRPWVLSYDYHPEIVELYAVGADAGQRAASSGHATDAHQLHTTQLLYGNRHSGKNATELIVTNLTCVPESHAQPAAR